MNRRRVIALLAVLLVVVVAAGWPVYVRPATDGVSASDPVDAVVALGGNTRTAPAALAMVRQGLARHAVISDPYAGQYFPWCTETPQPDRTCFVPDPSTTRGEARAIERMARENGWDDVAVIAPTFHIARARYIVKRCYGGRLRMVDPHVPTPAWVWVYQYAYQTAGWLRAFSQHGC